MDTLELLGNAHLFLDCVFTRLAALGIDVRDCRLDHLCYRVASQQEYALLKTKFAQIATLLHEARIGGRPIATFKLAKPIEYKNRQIFCVELPAPKTGKTTQTGWEHVEFVIHESFEDFMRRYPQAVFDVSGIAKPHNPEIELVFEDCAVKFHHVALEDLVAREARLG